MLDPTLILVILAGVTLLVAFDNWRRGLLLVIPAGFLQDPLRKLTPGQPPYFLTLAAAVFVLAFFSMLTSGPRLRFAYLHGGDRRLERAWKGFLIVVALQSVHTLVRYGNPVVFGLGLANYLAPVAALIAGFLYPKDEERIWRFMRLYLIFAVPFCLTVYLSYWLGEDWDVLKDIGSFVGREMIIYSQDTVFYSHPGFFRVGEIAAWHAATASVILILFATRNKSPLARVLISLVVAALIGAIFLTGRRKMLTALSLFFGFYAFFLSYFWGQMRRAAAVAVLLALVGSVILNSQQDDSSELYVRRGLSVFGDASDRLTAAVGLMKSAFSRQGLFGAGAGVAAQGTQYFSSGVDVAGTAESGLGKVTTELGVPGLAVSAWLFVALGRHLARMFRHVPKRFTSLTVLMAGTAAFLLANGATFLVAMQLYGDLFILILMGLFGGFILASQRLAHQRLAYEARARRSYQDRAPVGI
jgi:hypothetical protein